MNRGFLLLLAAVVAAALAVGAILSALTAPSAPAAQAAAASRATPVAGQPSVGGAGTAQGQGGRMAAGAAPASAAAQGAPGSAQGSRTTGTISSVDGDTITLSTPQGDVKVKTAEAKIQKTVDGTVADLETGQRITVQGQRNDDGSYSASLVQVVPESERAAQPASDQVRESGRGPAGRPTATGQ